ncbi:2-hydroxyacid dehydrogenase [Flavihumibacter sp. R14]|nr:2-hydroxyacid dehydrogenase [Flavihumibacter soli]
MRVVAYSIKTFEKEFLAKANQKKHDITLISNALSLDTALYAEGKDAVVVFTNDDVSAPVINKLADIGISYIATRSVGTDHIDLEEAKKRAIKVANIPAYSPEAIAEFAVTLALALSRQLISTVDHCRNFDFAVSPHPGFNFHGKTVGIIGLGHTGLAAASIFKGFGCKVIGYDISMPLKSSNVTPVGLEKLLREADIISLHVPLTSETQHLINAASIDLMKPGVMLINTSRGAVINTTDIVNGLDRGKIGYLGLDVYENERGLFLSDRKMDPASDPLLDKLMKHPNVIVTPHQAFLTAEALNEIALKTIQNLDEWQRNISGKVCA